jgi:hypothetical protein
MKRATAATILASLGLALAGCSVQYDGDDRVTHRLGSDYFGAGGSLRLTDMVEGDAFLAGGRIETASEVTGDLIAAGGDVRIGGSVGDDLYVAGADVQVDAIVSGNARVAGGDVTLGPATVVTGAVSLSGGRVRHEGTAHGNLQAAGGFVRIDGAVTGDAEVRAEEVEVGPDARISGRLLVRSPRPPHVAESAEIAGGLDYQEASPDRAWATERDTRHLRTIAHGVGSFLWIVGVFVVGMLFTLAFPAYSARAADWIGREPLRSLGLGFVLLVCLPILAVLLLITIVGIPLALLLLLLYLVLLFLGWVTSALFLGRKGLTLVRGDRPTSNALRMLALLLAVLGLWLLGRLPYVGGWITFVALLLGIGALVWQGWPRRDAPAGSVA